MLQARLKQSFHPEMSVDADQTCRSSTSLGWKSQHWLSASPYVARASPSPSLTVEPARSAKSCWTIQILRRCSWRGICSGTIALRHVLPRRRCTSFYRCSRGGARLYHLWVEVARLTACGGCMIMRRRLQRGTVLEDPIMYCFTGMATPCPASPCLCQRKEDRRG